MKLNRRQLRRMIAESYGDMNDPYNPKADPDLVQKDMDDDPIRAMGFPDYQESGKQSSGASEMTDAPGAEIVQSMLSEIEESHGGLDTEEAAGELVRRLEEAGVNPEGYLAQALLDAELKLRSMGRRS